MLDTERQFSTLVVNEPPPSRKSYSRIFDWVLPPDPISYECIEMYREEDYQEGRKDLFLFSLEPEVMRDRLDVLIELEELGFRGLFFGEIMSFAASSWYRELQGFTLPALGAIGRLAAMHVVPAITWNDQGRGLLALPVTTKWNGNTHRILTVARL